MKVYMRYLLCCAGAYVSQLVGVLIECIGNTPGLLDHGIFTSRMDSPQVEPCGSRATGYGLKYVRCVDKDMRSPTIILNNIPMSIGIIPENSLRHNPRNNRKPFSHLPKYQHHRPSNTKSPYDQ